VKRRETRALPNDSGDIWITEMSRDTTSRFTFEPSQLNVAPIWSPDGARIVFASLRGGKWGLYVKPSNGAGAEERLFESQSVLAPVSWAPDGRSNRKPALLVGTRFNDNRGQVSPDGKWLAYDSTESGQSQVYVRPFPTGDSKWQISTGGGVSGFFPRWRGDGHELFYMDALNGGKLIAVDVKVNGTAFEAGAPKVLFDSGFANLGGERLATHAYAVTADGQRFLVPRPASTLVSQPSAPIAVTLNWAEGIQH
jgi:eukaryotic-like serine/threonine-protein kinase